MFSRWMLSLSTLLLYGETELKRRQDFIKLSSSYVVGLYRLKPTVQFLAIVPR